MLILRRILAVIAGLAVVIVLSTATDMLLENSIFPGLAKAQATTGVWLFVTAYRAVYSIAGCYVAARLAPDHPMVHALVLGVIGFLLASLGAYVMWSKGTHWYPIALIVSALPCAWIGGWLYTRGR
ncbi:MAG: hypothetical protein ACTHPD_01175 [Rhizomicrobium sp.]